jgi:hypothetical protein
VVIVVREAAAAANGDEPRIPELRQDHPLAARVPQPIFSASSTMIPSGPCT